MDCFRFHNLQRSMLSMILENIEIDILKIDELIGVVSDEEIKSILLNYRNNCELLLGTLAVPLLCMSHGRKDLKQLQYWMEGAIVTKNAGKEKTEKGRAEIHEYIAHKFEAEHDTFTKEIIQEIEKLQQQMPILALIFQYYSYNIIVMSWTYFESAIKDLWLMLLNRYPKQLIGKIIERGEDAIDGITGKNISINLLAKYDYDISHHLGDILCSKYDFSCVTSIRKAMRDLFDIQERDLQVLDNDNLIQLEITRHLIVHRAGIIDSDYQKRSRKTAGALGDKISPNEKEVSEYCNSAIYAILELFRMADAKIQLLK